MEEQRPEDPPFRSISPNDYKNLDQATKDRIIRARHMGIIRSSEERIRDQLLEALKNPRMLENGAQRPPYKHEELVVVLMHVDDPVMLPPVIEACKEQNLEVAMFISERITFAQGLQELPIQHCPHCGKASVKDVFSHCPGCAMPAEPTWRTNYPYKKLGKTMMQPPPPKTVYIAVFDMGMSTMTFIGFDPDNPNATHVQADPNVLPPAPVDGVPVEPKKQPQIDPPK